jgi:hypothetical protein
MKLLEFIQNVKNNFYEEMEVNMPAYLDGIDLDDKWYDYEEVSARELLWNDYICIVIDVEAKQIRALQREMRMRMLKPIGSIKQLRRLLFSHISLLFGMCCSQSSLIINAFFGNSLSRIPSL